MFGGDEVGRFPEGSRAFVHFHDFVSVADVGPRTAAAHPAGRDSGEHMLVAMTSTTAAGTAFPATATDAARRFPLRAAVLIAPVGPLAIGLADVLTAEGDGKVEALERAAALARLPQRARDRALADVDAAEGLLGDAMRRLAEQLGT